MSPAEQALANQNPSFADLCDRLRSARIAHAASLTGVARAERALNEAKSVASKWAQAVEAANVALDELIERAASING